MKPKYEEPLVAIILKGVAILSMIGAVIYFVKGLSSDYPPAERSRDMEHLTENFGQLMQAAMVQASYFHWAFVCAGSAISLWWMGAVLALLDRIACNREEPEEIRSAAPLKRRTEVKPGIFKEAASREDGGNDEISSYKL